MQGLSPHFEDLYFHFFHLFGYYSCYGYRRITQRLEGLEFAAAAPINFGHTIPIGLFISEESTFLEALADLPSEAETIYFRLQHRNACADVFLIEELGVDEDITSDRYFPSTAQALEREERNAAYARVPSLEFPSLGQLGGGPDFLEIHPILVSALRGDADAEEIAFLVLMFPDSEQPCVQILAAGASQWVIEETSRQSGNYDQKRDKERQFSHT